jgi:hypothetical protein
MKVGVVLAVVTTLLAAACGNDQQDDSAGGSTSTTRAESNVVEVAATEYVYEMPEAVTGGVVTFDFSNQGAQPHEFAFVRLDDGKTIDDLKAAFEMRREPKWARDLAGVPVLSPGGSTAMTRELEPGSYAFFCFLPAPDGMPHIAHGMIEGFDVSDESDAQVPAADFVISVTEEGFSVPDVPAGRSTVELRNEGRRPHEFAILSFEAGKKERDLGKWFNSGYKGETPALFPGGIQAIGPGESVVMEIDFVAGRTYTVEDFPNDLRSKFIVR